MAKRRSARKRTIKTPQVSAPKPDTKYASFALGCALLSWVPLLNLAIVPLGIVFGIMGVRRARTYPKRDGMVRAVIGLVVCCVWLVMTLYAISVYGPATFLQR